VAGLPSEVRYDAAWLGSSSERCSGGSGPSTASGGSGGSDASVSDDARLWGGRGPHLPELPNGCHELNQPGELDPACHDTVVGVGMAETPIITFPGCCRPDGKCGAVMGPEIRLRRSQRITGASEACDPP
jgi:hypothetical protein